MKRYGTGWRLVLLISLGLIAMSAGLVAQAASDVDAARLVIRWTARTSVVLFLLAFTASALREVVPGAGAALMRRRRALGLSFAVSHGLHLAAILTLARLDPDLFASLTNAVTISSGVIAYLFIAAMAVTSNSWSVLWLGPVLWRRLHTTGAWYIYLSFVVAFGKRAVINPDYLPAMLLLGAALLLKLIAAWRRRRSLPGNVPAGG